jgi:hypothetical protein
MGDGAMTCDVCNGESGGEFVGVAAIPGAPISIAWCRTCLAQNAVPTFIFDYDYVHVAGGDATRLNEWARSRTTWIDGAFVRFDDYIITRWTPERVQAELDAYDQSRKDDSGGAP